MTHINVEIKARCQHQDFVRKFLLNHRADYKGTDHQIDTYFQVPHGRLKLREGKIENFLIFYNRENIEGPKKSDVSLFSTQPGSSLKAILEKACGILAIVDKQREIYFIDNVKFHIDTVKTLGTFVEIEAIDKHGNIGQTKLQQQCQQYMNDLHVQPADLLSVSYSDLLLVRSEEGSS